MRNWLAPLAALSFLITVGTANADVATGKIKVLDVENAELILENGVKFSLVGAKFEDIKVGDTIRIEYADVEGELQVSRITKVEG